VDNPKKVSVSRRLANCREYLFPFFYLYVRELLFIFYILYIDYTIKNTSDISGIIVSPVTLPVDNFFSG